MNRRSQARLTREQHQEIFRRAKNGEKSGKLALEFGISRQAIEKLVTRFAEAEKANTEPARQGRPKMDALTQEHLDFLRETMDWKSPSDAGLENHARWTLAAAMELLHRKFQIAPSRTLTSKILHSWGKRTDPEDNAEDPDSDQAYYDYINSPAAAEIRRREKEWQQHEEQRLAREGPAKRRRGRPPKKSPVAPDAETDSLDDDEDFPLTIEDMQRELDAFPDQQMVRTLKNRHLPKQPGLRLGKHGNNRGARHQRKKRR
ncbi:MAG: hypothetical protein KA004_02700 [Verrucomicrobiales bacterium]|nr:hypothetical protein [Verrucomicrobiales bacterium]